MHLIRHSILDSVLLHPEGVLTPTAFKCVEVGGADQALVRVPDCLEKQLLASGRLSRHIIQREQRRIAAALADQLQFSQLQRQHRVLC